MKYLLLLAFLICFCFFCDLLNDSAKLSIDNEVTDPEGRAFGVGVFVTLSVVFFIGFLSWL